MINILVTGSNGQLGSELKEISNQYSQFNFIFTDIEDLNITDTSQLRGFFNNQKINYLINCAAYTAVDKAEDDKRKAELINVTAVANLTKLCSNHKIKLIHISSDYVFDGKSTIPYTEGDTTNPVSVYGMSKLKGETEALRHRNTIIIRTSWLYSSYGNNFVKTMLKLTSDRDEIGVVNDQLGNPTYAKDLAYAILQIIQFSEENPDHFKPGIYNYANEGECTWYELTCEIVNQTGSKCKVNPILTKDYPTAAKRPAYSVFNKEKIKLTFNIEIPNWKDSLTNCLSVLKKNK